MLVLIFGWMLKSEHVQRHAARETRSQFREEVPVTVNLVWYFLLPSGFLVSKQGKALPFPRVAPIQQAPIAYLLVASPSSPPLQTRSRLPLLMELSANLPTDS